MKRILEAYESINETGLNTTFTGNSSHVQYCDYVSFDVILTNGALMVSVFSVEGSHDGIEWFDVETSSTMNLNGATEYLRFNMLVNNWKYLRPVITRTSGSGDVRVLISASSLSN